MNKEADHASNIDITNHHIVLLEEELRELEEKDQRID